MKPSPRQRANAPKTTTRCTASPACSPTWPPSAPTTFSPPVTCQHSPSSPPQPHCSGGPSNYSASPTATVSCSQYTQPARPQNRWSQPNTPRREGELRAKLARDNGPLQMSLFDQQDLAEIAHPDYPGERLIACRNPALADERARKRGDLLAATAKEFTRISERVGRGTLSGAAEIGKAVGKVSGKYKVDKHFHTTIADTSFTFERNQTSINAEAALDGIYVLRTSVTAETLD